MSLEKMRRGILFRCAKRRERVIPRGLFDLIAWAMYMSYAHICNSTLTFPGRIEYQANIFVRNLKNFNVYLLYMKYLVYLHNFSLGLHSRNLIFHSLYLI